MNNREAMQEEFEAMQKEFEAMMRKTFGEGVKLSKMMTITGEQSDEYRHPSVRDCWKLFSALASHAHQTESKLDCVKVTTGDHDKFHELLEAILNAGERVAMPVSFLSIINEAGMKFIKLLPPAPEYQEPTKDE